MKVPEIEPPAAALLAPVLANEPIEPALKAAGELEIAGSIVSTSASSRTAR